VSVYVKGNAAATYTCELEDVDNTRRINQAFAVTTDWTRVILTFAADTSDPLDDDVNNSLQLNIWLHGGATYSGGTFVSNAWKDIVENTRMAESHTSIFDSDARTFFITGVQMEVGSVATPFEHRSFGEELALCQRYFLLYADGSELIGGGGSQSSTFPDVAVIFPLTMRVDATLVQTSGTDYYGITTHNAVPVNFDDFTVAYNSSPRSQLLYPDENVSGTQGSYARFFCNSNGRISFNAEL